MDIHGLRKEIDMIDRELVRLFCQRMEVASRIADYKRENDLPIFHPGRELEVLEKVASMAETGLAEYVQSLYLEIFKLSRQYQTAHNEGI